MRPTLALALFMVVGPADAALHSRFRLKDTACSTSQVLSDRSIKTIQGSLSELLCKKAGTKKNPGLDCTLTHLNGAKSAATGETSNFREYVVILDNLTDAILKTPQGTETILISTATKHYSQTWANFFIGPGDEPTVGSKICVGSYNAEK